MGLLNLFGGDSESNVRTDIRNATDSYNTSYSSSNILSESGNVSFNFGDESSVQKAVPLVLGLVVSLGAIYLLTKR